MQLLKKNLPIIFISIIFFIFFYNKYASLIVMFEATDYIKTTGYNMNFLSFLEKGFIPTGDNSRYFSMFTFYIYKSFCGYDNVCINVYQLLLFIIIGILLYWHSYQLHKNVWTSSFVSILYLFSLPVLDGMIWQATNHDKVAAVITLFTLIIAIYFFKKEKNSLFTLFFSNFILTILLLFAYNSKEASFCLMPLIISYYFIFSKSTRDFLQKKIIKILIPSLFSIYFILGYFYFLDNSIVYGKNWQAHILSNSILNNFKAFVPVLFNRTPWLPNNHVIFLFGFYIFFIIFLFIIYMKKIYRDNRFISFFKFNDPFKKLIYTLCFFIFSFLIVMKTRNSAFYYMIIPYSAFLLSVSSLFHATIMLIRSFDYKYLNPKFLTYLLIFLTSSFILFTFYNYQKNFQKHTIYSRILIESHNLQETFQTIRETFLLEEKVNYYIYLPLKGDYFYYLIGYLLKRRYSYNSLVNFIYQKDGDYKLDIELYEDIKKIKKQKKGNFIFLDNMYKVIKVYKK